ncbi:hypothetical protein J3459_010459 [Metarhizium acridum]|nr:hypothetical protein J3459_010459 [Metarhizium acridum]
MLSGFSRHPSTPRALVTTLFGGILLSLEVAAGSDKVLTEIIETLSEFGDQLPFLQISGDSGALDDETLAALFEILEALTVNIVRAIKYFRRRNITDTTIAPNSA